MAATVVGSASSVRVGDDVVTICAISLVAAMIANVVHEGLGHAAHGAAYRDAVWCADDRCLVERF